VYAAGEAPIQGADAAALQAALPLATLVPDIAALPQAIADATRDGDVVIVMGAGTIGSVPARTVELLTTKEVRP